MTAPRTSLVRILLRFWPEVRRRLPLIIVATAALLAEIVFRVLEPWPLKIVFDLVLPVATDGAAPATPLADVDPRVLLAWAAIAVVVIAAARAFAAYVSTVGFAVAGNRVLTDVRSALFAHLQRLGLAFHDRARTGDLLTRVVGDIGRVQEVSVTAAMPLAANLLTLVGMLGVMAWMNWRLSLVALAILPLFLLASGSLGGRIRAAARQQRRREGRMGATAAEAIGAIRTVQALGLEHVHSGAFDRENSSSLREGVRTRRLSARLERTVDVLIAVGTAAVLWWGALLVRGGALTAGDLVVFLAYLKGAYKPVRDLAKYTGRLAKASASAERVLEILDAVPEVRDAADAIEAPSPIETITFESVTFAYGDDPPAVDGIDLAARRGEVIGLVGASGGGKSTLMSLLLRLYDPSAGRIAFDGIDLRRCAVASVRSRTAVVPQDAVLFGVSIRENIAYGRPGATDADVEAAARAARAHEFIAALPAGYDTIVGERGETLSGGQRQRIALARAVVRPAPILVLDEPAANLDEANAVLVRAALRELRADRITFVIAHDLATVREADRIIVLREGRIAEQGTHEALLAADGWYARMVHRQQGRAVVAPPEGAHAHSA